MQRALILTAAAVAALSLAACNKSAEKAGEDASATAAAANPGQTEPVNAAQDAVGAAVGQTSAATLGSHTTGGFVSNAAMSDMYEIQAGQMAAQRGKHADVKAFGKMMVTDHTAMSNQLKPLATAAGETPPTELDQRRKGMIDNLRAASDADFDKVYVTQQIAAHEEALTLAQGYAQNGDNAGLKAHAAKGAPKIQAHLEKARQIQGKLDQGGANTGGAQKK